MFSLPGIGRRFSSNVGAFLRVLSWASQVSCIWNKCEPKASLRGGNGLFLFLLSFSLSLRSIREVTLQRSGRAKSRLALRPPSLRPIKPSSRLSTSGGRWPSSPGTYYSLTTRWYSKGIGLKRGTRLDLIRQIRPTRSRPSLWRPYHDRKLLRLRDFGPVTRNGDMALVKGP